MDKKIGRLLRPSVGLYFVLLLGFAVATAVLRQYWLAGIEMVIWVLVLVLYLLHRSNRRKQLKTFIAHSMDVQTGVQGQRTPFPMMVVRLADEGIVYVNDQFHGIFSWQIKKHKDNYHLKKNNEKRINEYLMKRGIKI